MQASQNEQSAGVHLYGLRVVVLRLQRHNLDVVLARGRRACPLLALLAANVWRSCGLLLLLLRLRLLQQQLLLLLLLLRLLRVLLCVLLLLLLQQKLLLLLLQMHLLLRLQLLIQLHGCVYV